MDADADGSNIVIIIFYWLYCVGVKKKHWLSLLLALFLSLPLATALLEGRLNHFGFFLLAAIWGPYAVREITKEYRASISSLWQKLITLAYSAAVVVGFSIFAVVKDISIDSLADEVKWPLIAAGGAWAGMKYLRGRR